MDSSKRFFHYTAKAYLPSIFKEGLIRLATTGIDRGERPAVWLSTNPIWDHTATKMAMKDGVPTQLTKEQQHNTFGLVRIEVKRLEGFVSWTEFGHTSGVSKQSFEFMETLGRLKGADPEEWWACFEPIREKDWVAVEVWEGSRWVARQNHSF